MISEQLLRDSTIRPTDDVLAAALDKAYLPYTEFVRLLTDFDVQPEWRYYNDGKAWLCKCLYKWQTSRGTDKEKTVLWLSVWEGFFKLSFYIGEKLRADLQSLALSESTMKMITEAKTMGKLKFFPLIFDVYSNELFGDLIKLINFQKRK